MYPTQTPGRFAPDRSDHRALYERPRSNSTRTSRDGRPLVSTRRPSYEVPSVSREFHRNDESGRSGAPRRARTPSTSGRGHPETEEVPSLLRRLSLSFRARLSSRSDRRNDVESFHMSHRGRTNSNPASVLTQEQSSMPSSRSRSHSRSRSRPQVNRYTIDDTPYLSNNGDPPLSQLYTDDGSTFVRDTSRGRTPLASSSTRAARGPVIYMEESDWQRVTTPEAKTWEQAMSKSFEGPVGIFQAQRDAYPSQSRSYTPCQSTRDQTYPPHSREYVPLSQRRTDPHGSLAGRGRRNATLGPSSVPFPSVEPDPRFVGNDEPARYAYTSRTGRNQSVQRKRVPSSITRPDSYRPPVDRQLSRYEGNDYPREPAYIPSSAWDSNIQREFPETLGGDTYRFPAARIYREPLPEYRESFYGPQPTQRPRLFSRTSEEVARDFEVSRALRREVDHLPTANGAYVDFPARQTIDVVNPLYGIETSLCDLSYLDRYPRRSLSPHNLYELAPGAAGISRARTRSRSISSMCSRSEARRQSLERDAFGEY